jgi:hypothetical protein
MNKVICILMVFTYFSLIAAESTKQTSAKRRRPSAPSGGLVIQETAGPKLTLVNAQKSIKPSEFQRMAFDLTTSLMLPWEVKTVSETENFQDLARKMLRGGSPGIVVVTENGDAPALLVAPEEGWSIVNISKLKENATSDEILSNRFTKELCRAAAWAVGGGNSAFQPCLLRGFSSMKELDKCPLLNLGPESINKIIDEANRRGVKSVKLASYRQACREGWAPAPTNDIQKAIWDKVHAMPTAPIKILPETKKIVE